MFNWTKSTRSVSVIIVLLTLSIALFMKIVSAEIYTGMAGIVIGSYFNKRDKKDT